MILLRRVHYPALLLKRLLLLLARHSRQLQTFCIRWALQSASSSADNAFQLSQHWIAFEKAKADEIPHGQRPRTELASQRLTRSAGISVQIFKQLIWVVAIWAGLAALRLRQVSACRQQASQREDENTQVRIPVRHRTSNTTAWSLWDHAQEANRMVPSLFASYWAQLPGAAWPLMTGQKQKHTKQAQTRMTVTTCRSWDDFEEFSHNLPPEWHLETWAPGIRSTRP